MDINIAVALIGLVGVLVAGLLSFHAGAQVRKSSTFATYTKTLIELQSEVRKLHNEHISIKNELDDVKDRNALLWAWVFDLLGQMSANNIDPVEPPQRLKEDEKLAEFFAMFFKKGGDVKTNMES